MNPSQKYGRSLHAQISLGTTSDDRFMPAGYVAAFANLDELVLTEKLDGQNNCFNKYGLFARSHTSPSVHPWDKPMRERWQLIRHDLKELEVFGENMYGIHSIAYHDLASYFYVFGIRERGHWLSWEEVQFYAAALDFPTVPQITISRPLQAFLEEAQDENLALARWLEDCLQMPWEESVETAGLLGGYDPLTGKPCSEGFVIRNAADFAMQQGPISVASNEFNNLFKLVRKSHVQTDEHWTKHWRPAPLVDYDTYRWHSYQYLSHS
ncbi:MAG: RNA ligase family protein [Bacteroidota bacterium]